MVLSLLTLVFAFLGVNALRYPCDEDSCPAAPNKCVKEGEFCVTQSSYYQGGSTGYRYDPPTNIFSTPSWNPDNPCGSDPLRMNCPVCFEENTICHQGRCLKLTQTNDLSNRRCCTHPTNCGEEVRHKYCQIGFECRTENADENGVLNEGICEPIKLKREIGETCDDSAQCDRGTCDTVTSVCTLTGVCGDNKDCEFGQYCKSYYNLTQAPFNIVEQRSCEPANFEQSTDAVEGSACDDSEIGNMDTAGQCGHEYVCSQDSNYGGKCIRPFSKSNGDYCSSAWDCKSGTFCSAVEDGRSVCVPIIQNTAGVSTGFPYYECCSPGEVFGCPHVSIGDSTKRRCLLQNERQNAVVRFKEYSASGKATLTKLQGARCQSMSPNMACADTQLHEGVKPPASQAKCQVKYKGYYSYSAASKAGQASLVIVLTSLLMALSFML